MMEVGNFYSSRANISYNTSLVLQDTQPDDAGVYQLTVQGLDVAHTTQITLILQGNDGFGGGLPNPKRWRGARSKWQVQKAQERGFLGSKYLLSLPKMQKKEKQLVLLKQRLR